MDFSELHPLWQSYLIDTDAISSRKQPKGVTLTVTDP